MGGMAWRVLGGGAAGLAGVLADRGLRAAWRAGRGTGPPENPEDPDTGWKEAIVWAAVSGAVIGLARLVATRQAAAYYRRSSGELPEDLRR